MKGYRTLIFSSLITIVGSLQQLGFIDLIPQEYQGISLAFIGLITAILRYLTTGPIIKS